MAVAPYALRVISDLALSTRANMLLGVEGRVLEQDSLITIFANQEAVSGEFQVTVGSTQALPAASPATLQATVGVMPIIPDDLLVLTAGEEGQEIVINYFNGDGAAAREGRVIVQVVPISAASLIRFLQSIGAAVPPGAAQALGS